MPSDIVLRDVCAGDLPVFFDQQLDEAANHMAAFTSKDPSDRGAFDAHWKKILADRATTKKTIVFGGEVVGHVVSYVQEGRLEVTYWVGRIHWSKGIATAALWGLLGLVKERPLYARAAKDNVASLRVLEKCGFAICGEDRGFANARGEEIEELVLELKLSNGENAR